MTPLWPQANGEAERFMKTIGKLFMPHLPNIGAGRKRCTFFAKLTSNTTRYNWHDTSRNTFRKSTHDLEIIPSNSNRKVQTRDRKNIEKIKYCANLRKNAKDRNKEMVHL